MEARFVINGRFLSRKFTGVDRYAYEIISELDKLSEPSLFELAIPSDLENIPVFNNIKVKKIGFNHGNMWEQIDFFLYAFFKNKKTINLCNSAPLLKPDVVAIFDTKINDHPEFFNKNFVKWYKFQFTNSLKRAKVIITDSISAKNDIIRNYKCARREKIHVVYPSWQHMEAIEEEADCLKKYNLKEYDYYFSLGSIEPNKNTKKIIEMARKNKDKSYVIAGSTDRNIYNGNGLRDDVFPKNAIFTGYIPDSEVKTLMRYCKGFIFPSFSEGFGMPPLEALSCGCRCLILSDIPVMREVYSNYASYIDPELDNDLFPEEKNISTDIRNKILSNFSWTHSADLFYKIIMDNYQTGGK